MKDIFNIFIILLLFSITCFAQNNKTKDNSTDKTREIYFIAVENMPEPVGGTKGIMDKIVVPDVVKSGEVEGTVFITAFVNEEGLVDSVKIIKSLHPDCDSAVAAAVKDTKFIPGSNKGKKVKV